MFDARKDPEWAADLLGYHLDLVDAAERLRVEQAFADPAALATARRRIHALLSPLDADPLDPPPPDLVAGILDRIDERSRLIRLPRRPLRAADEAHAPRPHFLVSFRELVGLAAAIAIFVGLFLPGYYTARRNAQQLACLNNLREIGGGAQQYAQQFNSPWPIAAQLPQEASWAAASVGGAPQARNSRNLYQLVKSRIVAPEAVICPGRTNDEPMPLSGVALCDDFPEPRNNSYSTALVASQWGPRGFRPDTPIAADKSPIVDENRLLIQVGPIPLNSDSHGSSRGQNVLYLDASVKFQVTPNAGIDNDDIYRVLGVNRYTGYERPRQRSDAFLIP